MSSGSGSMGSEHRWIEKILRIKGRFDFSVKFCGGEGGEIRRPFGSRGPKLRRGGMEPKGHFHDHPQRSPGPEEKPRRVIARHIFHDFGAERKKFPVS